MKSSPKRNPASAHPSAWLLRSGVVELDIGPRA
jgi:hypothetical protein